MTKSNRQIIDAERVACSKQNILDAAIKVAERRGGWVQLTRCAVAKQAECSEGLPSKYFGTMVNFRRAIMREAIQRENLSIIAQGLAAADKCALKAPPELRVASLQDMCALKG